MRMLLIQARSTSKRFPGKILEKLGNFTLLEWVHQRLAPLGIAIAFVVPNGDKAIEYIRNKRWGLFQGSKENVLDRYYKAARHFDVQGIVRITADCPFIDPSKVLAVY